MYVGNEEVRLCSGAEVHQGATSVCGGTNDELAAQLRGTSESQPDLLREAWRLCLRRAGDSGSAR